MPMEPAAEPVRRSQMPSLDAVRSESTRFGKFASPTGIEFKSMADHDARSMTVEMQSRSCGIDAEGITPGKAIVARVSTDTPYPIGSTSQYAIN